MRVTIRFPAEPHTVFAAGAFDQYIDEKISLVDLDGQRHRGTLLGAEVVEDGAAALMTLETDVDLDTTPFNPPPWREPFT